MVIECISYFINLTLALELTQPQEDAHRTSPPSVFEACPTTTSGNNEITCTLATGEEGVAVELILGKTCLQQVVAEAMITTTVKISNPRSMKVGIGPTEEEMMDEVVAESMIGTLVDKTLQQHQIPEMAE